MNSNSSPGAYLLPDNVDENSTEKSPKKRKLDEEFYSTENPFDETTKLDESLAVQNESFERDGRCDDDVWVVKKVDEGKSDDEPEEQEESQDGRQMKKCSSHNSSTADTEEGFKNMCLHEVVERRMFSDMYTMKDEDVNHANEFGETPLHFASEIGAEGFAMLLLDRGADPNATDDLSFTPLILAANFGHAGVAEILLDMGADVDKRDEEGKSPLHFAANAGHEDVVRLLLERGADVMAMDEAEQHACDYAKMRGRTNVALLLQQAEGASRNSAE